MKEIEITEKEFDVINEIAKNFKSNQRGISKNVGISLGMTNIILKRLAKKGWVKFNQLDKKRMEYILTPEGFKEKARKSYQYFLKTIDSLGTLKRKIIQVLREEYSKGRKKFVILGDGELAIIVEAALKDLRGMDFEYRKVKKEDKINDKDSLILVCNGKTRKTNGRYWI